MTLTRSEIERVLGPIDEHLAAEISATEATTADLTMALAWLEADEARVNEGDHLPTGKVAELIGILETADDEEGYALPPSQPQDWAQ
ncbi:hypothetical protein [Pelagibacterium halotolerans]|uniref:Uncharacterized protein n=1 Tax=Pelagibacterium halotolerans (strain DSM 22347 / JCM 15775 / CGMCC 1.7692 / B2) TaxID=1082931 RepID=G4RE49_PELHB|nr:hypothetical protein [Pelagibacterium halotolerans]AEQ50843.1 hypothetical protein KKY_804 [Pelagibacterium halotolerans B2]QJR19244.1 hypothetical protein HKM20_12835 [Pelagibacterium halotolerans]SDZ97755.1 hypothetical protein SAMN05428936_101734 [Pelagibacterium halotolerans]